MEPIFKSIFNKTSFWFLFDILFISSVNPILILCVNAYRVKPKDYHMDMTHDSLTQSKLYPGIWIHLRVIRSTRTSIQDDQNFDWAFSKCHNGHIYWHFPWNVVWTINCWLSLIVGWCLDCIYCKSCLMCGCLTHQEYSSCRNLCTDENFTLMWSLHQSQPIHHHQP